jgi:hypothetical protein
MMSRQGNGRLFDLSREARKKNSLATVYRRQCGTWPGQFEEEEGLAIKARSPKGAHADSRASLYFSHVTPFEPDMLQIQNESI